MAVQIKGSSTLAGQADVTLTNPPKNGDGLVYQSATGQWTNQAGGGGGGATGATGPAGATGATGASGAGAPGGSNHQVQINSSGTFAGLATGTAGQVLTSNGAAADPSFQAGGGGGGSSIAGANAAPASNLPGGNATATGGAGDGTGAGGDVNIVGGLGGTGVGGGGGNINITSGQSQDSTSGGAPGSIFLITSDAVTNSGQEGGEILLQAGMSPGTGGGGGGRINLFAGGSDSADGGNVNIQAGGGQVNAGKLFLGGGVANGGSGANGGNVCIELMAGDGAGLEAELQIGTPLDSAITPIQLSFLAGINPNNSIIFTAQRKMRVKAIVGRLEVASGLAATLTVSKAPSGTALSGGTLLHSGSFDANGTAATNQTLTLSATAADLEIATGDSIGVRTTGTWTASAGGITVWLTPQ